jgi:hypothetical protein
MKVIVLNETGDYITLDEWQKNYGLVVGSDRIGKYFSITEHRFAQDINDYGHLVVNALLIKVLDRYRELKGFPVCINSFNRDQAKQDQLKKSGARAATTSPHVAKMAADVDTPGIEELKKSNPKLTNDEAWLLAVKINHDQVKLFKQASTELGINIRIGYKEYLEERSTFIHVDVCPEYYGPGKRFYKLQHPKAWEQPITW